MSENEECGAGARQSDDGGRAPSGARELQPDHDPHHGHSHEHTEPPPESDLRIKALESLLIEKGVIDPEAIDQAIDLYEHRVGPRNGARIVARAWADPAFRERLLADANAAIAELEMEGVHGADLILVENTERRHNVIVCTLCSCYPWQTLGLPPAWFKSAAYRSRIVADPRSVLQEFGLELPEDVEVCVWDSNADIRYMVLPRRPEGTQGWSEDRLMELVTRDAMIGTGLPETPA